ncbi:hypothetical protein C8F01DRAFT_1379499 [Mycena amicta]|nr:hypothetical protein C8F01DRAFT_1379499 [Mycena amicta]
MNHPRNLRRALMAVLESRAERCRVLREPFPIGSMAYLALARSPSSLPSPRYSAGRKPNWTKFSAHSHSPLPPSHPRIAILGPGGIGKTSLAKAVLHDADVAGRYDKQRYFVVPMVSTSQQAASVVADSKFPPVAHAVDWGMRNIYADELGDIETWEGLYNVKEIAEVDGVGARASYRPIRPLHLPWLPAPSPAPVPEFEEKIQYIRTQSQSVGKKCAIYCTSGAQAARRVKEGFDMVNVISDVGALSSAIQEHVSRALAGQD